MELQHSHISSTIHLLASQNCGKNLIEISEQLTKTVYKHLLKLFKLKAGIKLKACEIPMVNVCHMGKSNCKSYLKP